MGIRRRLAALAAAITIIGAGASAAHADDIKNTLDGSIDATAEIMALNVGGANGTTTLAVVPANEDGKQGCNLTKDTVLTVSVNSSQGAVATVSPSSVAF